MGLRVPEIQRRFRASLPRISQREEPERGASRSPLRERAQDEEGVQPFPDQFVYEEFSLGVRVRGYQPIFIGN